jgi:hypothetical protein
MSKRQWLTVLGVWVALFLFLGFPSAWHKIIAIISGIAIIAISYNLPHEKKEVKEEQSAPVFTENNSSTNI